MHAPQQPSDLLARVALLPSIPQEGLLPVSEAPRKPGWACNTPSARPFIVFCVDRPNTQPEAETANYLNL